LVDFSLAWYAHIGLYLRAEVLRVGHWLQQYLEGAYRHLDSMPLVE